MNEYTFYSDPGHAWLAVPLQEFIESGAEVSSRSYVCTTRNTVYLEEDIDAYRFLKAKGFIIDGDGEYQIEGCRFNESHSKSSSWIRQLPSIDTVTRTVSMREVNA